jgi:hypothetical protein
MDWLASSSDTVKTCFWIGLFFAVVLVSVVVQIVREISREGQHRKRQLTEPETKPEKPRSVFAIQQDRLEAHEDAERRRLAERQRVIKSAHSIFSLLKEGGLEVGAVGAGLSCVRVRLKGKFRFPILVPAGTFFRCHTTTIQNMICLRNTIFSLHLQPTSRLVRITTGLSGARPDQIMIEEIPEIQPPGSCLVQSDGSAVELFVPAACVDMDKPQPESVHEFTVLEPSRAELSADLRKLLGQLSQENGPLLSGDFESLPTKAAAEFNRFVQFAVWTITANPTRDGFTGILDPSATESLEERRDRGHPTNDELSQIRGLLERASLDPIRYEAFR